MTTAPVCPECGDVLPSDARRGVCPKCLLRSVIEPAPVDETIHLVLADGRTEALPFPEIGDYELIERIGDGGMGIIFKARQRSLDRLVALKLIRSGSLARPDDLARFRTEAAAAARLDHPNIVAIYEIGEQDGRPYFSMEFVAGRSVAEALQPGPLPPKQAAELISKVAGAIHFAHENGVLHRDLKPSNILIGPDDQPRVVDFGLAKIVHHNAELTLSGAVIGSPGYMPPEQACGRSAQANVRSDVYSLGAVLYEMLTGRPPFAAATPLETMKLVLEQDPIPPRSLNPLLPRNLETICLKCLAKEPSSRFGSAQELAEELGRFLRDEPILSQPSGMIERSLRWCRRKPVLATLAAVLILAPAIIISLLAVMGTKLAHQRNRALAQEQSTAENLYAVDIALAFKALDEYDYNLAWRSLKAHFPSNSIGETTNDLRGFEWRWLWGRAQGGAASTLTEHLGEITCVSWSSDGRFIASASSDGTARLWDAEQMKCLQIIENPAIPKSEKGVRTEPGLGIVTPHMVNSVSFSADSRVLITGMGTGVDTWDLASGRRLMTISTNVLNMGLFSPVDPGLALTTCLFPRTSWGFLDSATGKMINVFTNGRADVVCFTPDGHGFARWDRKEHRIYLQTVPSGEVTGSIDASGIYIACMAITPDGKTLVAGSLGGPRIEVFDLISKRSSGGLAGHTGRLLALAISPDGRMLASGGFDQTIRLWNLPDRKEVRQLYGHRAAVSALAFSPDGRRLFSGGYDSTIRFWDVDAPAIPPSAITNVNGEFVFSSDGRWLVTQTTNDTIRLWRTADSRLLNQWPAVPFQSAVISTNGVLLSACLGKSNEPVSLHLQDMSTGSTQTVPLKQGPAASCTALNLSLAGTLLATGHADGSVALWDVPSGRLLRTASRQFQFLDRPWKVDAVEISPDGQMLFGGSFERVAIRTWGTRDFQPMGNLHLGSSYPLHFSIAPDGKQIATSGNGQGLVIDLWDEHLHELHKLSGQADSLDELEFAPNGRTLVAAGIDGKLKLWHLPTERELGTMMTLPKDVRFSHLAFSPDGSWLGVSDTTGRLHLFHAPDPD